MGSVANGEETHLFAGHELLNHHLRTGVAKATLEHMLEGVAGFVSGFSDNYALSRSEPICLDYYR
jgi:hypothetical protein